MSLLSSESLLLLLLLLFVVCCLLFVCLLLFVVVCCLLLFVVALLWCRRSFVPAVGSKDRRTMVSVVFSGAKSGSQSARTLFFDKGSWMHRSTNSRHAHRCAGAIG